MFKELNAQPVFTFQAVLEGIRKGEIVSSGAVHNSTPKEGSLNRGMRQDSLGRGRGRGVGRGVGTYLNLCRSA